MKPTLESFGLSNVASFLLKDKAPHEVALRMMDRDITYGDLQTASAKIARYLISEGGRTGDRALLAADNSLFWVAAYLGVLQAGLICVPLPTAVSGEDLHHILETTECRFAFVNSKFAVIHKNVLSEVRLITDCAD